MHRRRQTNEFIYLESNKTYIIIKEGRTIMSGGDNMQGKVNYKKWARASVLVIGLHGSELLLYATNDKQNVTVISWTSPAVLFIINKNVRTITNHMLNAITNYKNATLTAFIKVNMFHGKFHHFNLKLWAHAYTDRHT